MPEAHPSVLLDRKRMRVEFGLGDADIGRVLRAVPVISFPGGRKVYIRRADLEALIEAQTFGKDALRPTA